MLHIFLLDWVDSMVSDMEAKKNFDAVIRVAFWIIWRVCNNLVFGTLKPIEDENFDDLPFFPFFMD